jgi:hypothetical protein
METPSPVGLKEKSRLSTLPGGMEEIPRPSKLGIDQPATD